MIRALSLRSIVAGACALGPLVSLACSASSGGGGASYEQLGDLAVNELTGSAMNGDPLGRGENGGGVRWRVATRTWVHVGDMLTLLPAYRLYPRCEDAAGNIYAEVINNGVWVLPAGEKVWAQLPLVDTDMAWDRPFANNAGELVMQSHRVTATADTKRLYRKAAGSADWVLASERPLDFYAVVGLADNGDVFLSNKAVPDQSPLVLRAGSDTPTQLADCGGAEIFPYCSSNILVNSRGDALFFGGGTRHLYLLKAGTTKPQLFGDLPGVTCCFNGGQALLADGTLVARMNEGGYDPYFLYAHKSAGGWVKEPPLPEEDGNHSVDILANAKGQLFTFNILLGQTTSTGFAFLVHL